MSFVNYFDKFLTIENVIVIGTLLWRINYWSNKLQLTMEARQIKLLSRLRNHAIIEYIRIHSNVGNRTRWIASFFFIVGSVLQTEKSKRNRIKSKGARRKRACSCKYVATCTNSRVQGTSIPCSTKDKRDLGRRPPNRYVFISMQMGNVEWERGKE